MKPHEELARSLLKKEMSFLSQDPDNSIAIAVVVTPSTTYYEEIVFSDYAEKERAYRAVVEKARERQAQAIIAINTARVAVLPENKAESYQWGDLETQDAERSLVAIISGPGIQPWALSVPFAVVNGKVVFGEIAQEDIDEYATLPDWP